MPRYIRPSTCFLSNFYYIFAVVLFITRKLCLSFFYSLYCSVYSWFSSLDFQYSVCFSEDFSEGRRNKMQLKTIEGHNHNPNNPNPVNPKPSNPKRLLLRKKGNTLISRKSKISVFTANIEHCSPPTIGCLESEKQIPPVFSPG